MILVNNNIIIICITELKPLTNKVLQMNNFTILILYIIYYISLNFFADMSIG